MRTGTRIVEELAPFFPARKHLIGTAVFALALPLAFPQARAQGAERSGKAVVETVCAGCHEKGIDGAPRIGDRKAWSKRASQGLSSLTQHALDGIRKMPAHGGSSGLSDLEIGRAVTYMVNRSGGNWVEPVTAKDLAAERSSEQVVKAQCAKCHKDGVGGAPKIGDREAWTARMKQGLDTLVRSAIRGHGGMPARGGQANLTDAETRAAILYMFNPAGAPVGAAEPARKAGADPNHKTEGGMEIYLGFMPAEALYSFPKDSLERTMHGGIPSGAGYYHVNVSLLDARTQAPIDGAQVEVRFERPGLGSESKSLEPMAIGAASYGNYVKLREKTAYHVTVRVRKPGATRTVEAKFEHRFD